jgi:hypothetical protein
MRIASICLGLLSALFCGVAIGDDATTQPDAAPDLHPTDLLGPVFTSKLYGLEFRPPLNCEEVHRPTTDTIVEFDRKEYDWRLRAWRVKLEQPLPLAGQRDADGEMRDGVIELALQKLTEGIPDAKTLRNEVITVGRLRVGMLAVRYSNVQQQRRLTEQAIVEVPDSNRRLYYFIDLTGPGKPVGEPDDVINPAEKAASDAFGEVVDSVQLLDQSGIARDQVERLYETRALFVNWTGDHSAIVRQALLPQQWLRVLRNGRDVGYSYVEESVENQGKELDDATIRVGVRSRTAVNLASQWDTITWMTCSLDRKHESWSTLAKNYDARGKQLDAIGQVGTSDEQTKAVVLQPQVDPDSGALGNGYDEHGGPLGQGNVDIQTVRTLDVLTTHGAIQLNPWKQDVPAFYIPQAVNFLLPRLLPLDRPKTYMFAIFVPDASGPAGGGTVMARYCDVLPVQQVSFNNQTFDAVKIEDRVGLEGPPTTYYFTPEGKFLGSRCIYQDGDDQITLTVLPADADTLQRLWNQPDLTIPQNSGQNAPAPDGSTPAPASP